MMLNARQQQAIETIEGPVMVIAGPGTGKTTILTLRIAEILKRTDVGPEGILALTYTNNAAAEIQRRLSTIIGADAYRVTITTFHGLCEWIISQHPERFQHMASRRIADDAERRQLMERLFAAGEGLTLLASFGDDPYYLLPALKEISNLKRDGISPDSLIALAEQDRIRISTDPDSISTRGKTKGSLKADAKLQLERVDRLVELAGLYRRYESALAVAGLHDYDDLITQVRDALEHDDNLRLSLQERFQYLLVDEHQDTNAAQNRIIELLADFHEQPNLFIVGDEKQAIYHFQGASVDTFGYFSKRFPGACTIRLTDNYRSTQTILDAAHGVRASLDPLTAQSERTPALVSLWEASSPDAQYYAVGRLIEQRIAAGGEPESIAVLYRTNADGRELAAYLARMGVPHTLEASLDVLKDPDIARLMLLLTAIASYGTPGPLYGALHVPWLNIPALDVYKLTAFCGRNRNPYDVIASMRLMSEAHLAEPDRLASVGHMLEHWHRTARQDLIDEALERVVRDSGCLDALVAHPQAPQKLAQLHALYDVARSLIRSRRQATLNDLTAHLAYIRDNNIRLSAVVPRLPRSVRLMTAHGAKGLEFDDVFMVDAYDGHWPKRAPASPLRLPASIARDASGEEQNLFYVALTRARHRAVISWPRQNRDGNELQQSRFVALIPPALATLARTEEIEQDYVANGHLRFSVPIMGTPDLANHAYLNELFTRQGLSATALNNYLTCPWQYFYRNLVRIPEASNIHLMYGNAVDKALEQYFNLRSTGEPATLEILLELFGRAIHDQPLNEQELRKALDRGRASLAGWHTHWQTTWTARSDHQVRIAGIPVPGHDNISINGKIDKLEYLDATSVRVVDYKTGRPKARDENYLRQLSFYRVLLDRWQAGRYQMREGILDFIDPDTRGGYKREAFAIEREQSDALMATIATVCSDILGLTFWNTTCTDTECRYCRLRRLAL